MRLATTVVIVVVAACRQPARKPELRVLLHEAGVENAYPRLSSDGREILYQSNRGGAWQLYVLDIATGASRALTHDANNNLPDWSPDGERIAFVSDRDGNEEVYIANADGTEAKRLTINPGRDLHPYFSADGKTLLYNSQRAGAPFDVYALDLVTGDEVRVTATPEDETCARYSPDGKRMIVLRNDARADDVWLIDAQGEHNLTNTPNIRDGWPVFDPRGRWVYFAGMDRGTFSLYRVRTDGTRREQLTVAAPGEEHARPVLSRDGTRVIFNIRRGGGIDIVELGPIAG